MTNIPATFATQNKQETLIRAARLLLSVAAPAAAVAADPSQSILKASATAGAKGYLGAIRIASVDGAVNKTAIHAELPINVRIWGSTGDLRKAIQGLPTTSLALWTGSPGDGQLRQPASNLEQAFYDFVTEYYALKVTGEAVELNVKTDEVTGRTYLEIDLILDYPTDTRAAVSS